MFLVALHFLPPIPCSSTPAFPSQIVSGSEDKTVRLWEHNGKAWVPTAVLQGHAWGINSVAFHPDGTKVCEQITSMGGRGEALA